MSRYPFPLCIQLTPPEDIYGDKEFAGVLSQLRELDFYGVELNLTDFSDPDGLTEFLAGYNLRLTMVATGFYANRNGLSLSSQDESVRKKTIERMGDILSFASACKAGIICGFVKGGPGQDRAAAAVQMAKSLDDLCDINKGGADIYLEATNHYEATLVNTLAEGEDFAARAKGRIRILPDTYHMNIEERSSAAAMVKYRSLYDNLHISDNNRYFPGLGSIDFFQVFELLKGMDYKGTISIEGRVLGSLAEDIAASAAYIGMIK